MPQSQQHDQQGPDGQTDQCDQQLAKAGVFLVGSERSGTTMLRLMLDHHPQLAWAKEFEYAIDQVGDDGHRPDVAEFADWLVQHRVFQETGFKIDPGLGYDDLVRSFVAQRGEEAGKAYVGATVHRHFDRLLEIWSDARFIHLVRDPRDVAPSVIKMGWAGTLYHGCARWVEAERLWDRLSNELPEDRHISIRFEDLLADPKEVLGELCTFLGLEFNKDMLAFHKDTTYDPTDPTASQRWKKTLSPNGIGLIEGRVGALLESRGYTPSGHPVVHPGAIMKAWLGCKNRIYRLGKRIKKYGIGLWAWALVTRRVSPNRLYRQTAQRMQAIDREHIR
jgi:sulfotransferase family protein